MIDVDSLLSALDRTTTTGALKRPAARDFVERAVKDQDRRARLAN